MNRLLLPHFIEIDILPQTADAAHYVDAITFWETKMKPPIFAALITLLLIGSAWAQNPPTDHQIDQARMQMLAGEAQFYQLAAQSLQVKLNEAAVHEAQGDAWWRKCITDPGCVAWVAPEKPTADAPRPKAPPK